MAIENYFLLNYPPFNICCKNERREITTEVTPEVTPEVAMDVTMDVRWRLSAISGYHFS